MDSLPTRSLALKVLLGVLSIAAAIVLILCVSSWHRFTAIYPYWVAVSIPVTAVLRLLSLAAIWRWSRAGVIAYVALGIFNVVIAIAIAPSASLLPSIVSTTLLVVLLWRDWPKMPWGLSVASTKN